MIINEQEYLGKVLGCWMGKNIGGTIGAPMEWRRQVNNVSFYTQELSGEPMPNDDLDIQLLWLIAMEERGVEIDAALLAEYWLLYVTPHWAEYGNAKIHLRWGVMPPLSGQLHNDYRDSCGAFIRSEIWACLAPGQPDLAARYALQDAMLDHGRGEGTYAEVFTAVLESAAFIVRDIPQLIGIALSYIPADCGVANAVACAIECHRSGKSWLEARDEILRHHRGQTFLGLPEHTSPEDHAKGFATGKPGYDVPSNIGIIIIGLLYGEGDFAKTICTAVNCGEDTDCTAATAGSIFGILHGIEGIPEKWIAPIGRKIKTACLNLGELGYLGSSLPQDVDDLTARTYKLTRQLLRRRRPRNFEIADKTTDLSDVKVETLSGSALQAELYGDLLGPKFHFDFFDIAVDYGQDGPYIRDAHPKSVSLKVINHYKVQANLNVHVYGLEGWRIRPGDGAVFSSNVSQDKTPRFEVIVEADRIAPVNRLVVEFTIPGRHTTMLVPLLLLSGNMQS